MKGPRFSAAAIGASAAAALGAVALNGKGAKDLVEAQKQKTAAEEVYSARRERSEQRRDATNGRVVALGQLQEDSANAAVARMRDFLRRHEKQVRDSDLPLLDGLETTMKRLGPPKKTDPMDAGTWVTGVAGSVAVGVGAGASANQFAQNYGVAGTGRKISTLAGAAREKAAKAYWGGGPKANGGGGIARGNVVMKAFTVSTGALAAGLVTKTMGTRALTQAREYEAQVAVACAELDLADAALDAVDQRIRELSEVLTRLTSAAVAELDALESVAFDIEEHSPQLQRALSLAFAVRDVAAAPLLAEDGELSERAETMIVKYRSTTKENEDD